MTTEFIPFEKTGYFSKFICDYINENQLLKSLYNHFPSIENFKKQIQEKQENYNFAHRDILVKSLENQYKNTIISEQTQQNIQALRNKNSFTITTGHQLSLFTGPLYFIYKIISTIKACRILNQKHTDYQFVPVYWMATEDHDFEEINHFYLYQKKIVWNSEQTGMVGNFSTQTLEPIAKMLKTELGAGIQSKELFQLFENSYLKNNDLASATRYLVNTLFKEYGLVIIDGNDTELKQLFIPYFEKDLFEHLAEKQVNKTITEIKNIDKNYPTQVTPRQINIFYLQPNIRERIIKTSTGFVVNKTNIIFSDSEIRAELQQFPERFSPNVLLRPMYQEVILPNLCYIGGGGEIAYWLELKAFFEQSNVTFPMLLLRNSVLLISEKQYKKIEKLQLSLSDIFLENRLLENKLTQNVTDIPLNFIPLKKQLQDQFASLYQVAQKTDVTFLNMVKEQEINQLKGLNALEKRLLKAQKRKYKDLIERATYIKANLFPNRTLQERTNNFSEFMIATQSSLIEQLMEHLNPFDLRFILLKYN